LEILIFFFAIKRTGKILRAAFFEPETLIFPLSRRSPFITNLAICIHYIGFRFKNQIKWKKRSKNAKLGRYKTMTLRTRRYIFWIFLALFLVIGAGAVFYSAGWRISARNCETENIWECLDIERTGAVFLETKQKGISISVNEKIFKDKPGIIQTGTLIKNLFPGEYSVKIEKDGYKAWEKKVEVEPQLVSRLSGIILVPEKPDAQEILIPEKISDFSFSGKGDAVFENSESIYYYNFKDSPLKLRGSEFISWNSDNTSFIAKDSSKNVLYLYKTSDLSKIFNISASFGNLKKNSPITEISFHPADPDKMIIQTKSGIDIFDSARLRLEPVSEGKIISWTLDNPNVYHIKGIKSGTSTEISKYGVFSFNLILKNETLVYEFSEEDEFNPGADPQISVKGKTAFVAENGKFFILNVQSKTARKENEKIKFALFSPDGKKIAVVGANDAIEILFLEDSAQKSEIEFYSSSLGVKKVFWHKDSGYIFAEYADGDDNSVIGFSETDCRLPINSYILAQGSNMNYDARQNKLYFIQEGKLKVLDLEAF